MAILPHATKLPGKRIDNLLRVQNVNSSVFQSRAGRVALSTASISFILVCLSTIVLSNHVSAFSNSLMRYKRKTVKVHCPLSIGTHSSIARQLTICQLVTERDVLAAVEEAERLWAQALEARKTANALSDRAEEEAEAAASSSQDVDSMFQYSKSNKIPITMQQLAQADAAAKSNLDAGSMVNRALQASEEADRLEKLAEAALQRSEEKLELHLNDFPNSTLAL